MTSRNKVITRIVTIIVFVGLYISASAQSNHWFEKLIKEYDAENKIEVSIERSAAQNDNHPYMDRIEEQDYQFVKWLYFINIRQAEESSNEENIGVVIKKVLGENNFNSKTYWSQVIRDKEEHKTPITFTIKEEGQMRYVTINNVVEIEEKFENDHNNDGWDFLGIRKSIAKIRKKGLLKDRDIQGDLPKGSMTFINASRNRLKCGVNVPQSSAYVKIDANDLEGNLIATLVDDELRKGWNNYKWTRGDHPKGKYQLSISVDDQTQNFKVK
jgi:hypothetical protein